MQEVRVALPNVVHVVRMYSISGEWFVFIYTIGHKVNGAGTDRG